MVSPFRLLKSGAHCGLGQPGWAANIYKGVDKRAVDKKMMSRSFLQMLSTFDSQALRIIDHNIVPKEFVGFVLSWDLGKPQASLNLPHSWGWLWTSDPLASISQVLGLQTWGILSGWCGAKDQPQIFLDARQGLCGPTDLHPSVYFQFLNRSQVSQNWLTISPPRPCGMESVPDPCLRLSTMPFPQPSKCS